MSANKWGKVRIIAVIVFGLSFVLLNYLLGERFIGLQIAIVVVSGVLWVICDLSFRRCPVCNRLLPEGTIHYNFCPYCGEKIDED